MNRGGGRAAGDEPGTFVRPPHVELFVQATVAGDVLVENRSTVELEIVHADGSSVGLPPTARDYVPSNASVRTPPGEDWTRPRPVNAREIAAAKRHGAQAYALHAVDFLWVTRLPDGRALFLLPWSIGGAQLSIGELGAAVYQNTWNYHPGHVDAAWQAALSWDGHGEPEGWTRHPSTGRVRPDGTPASETNERGAR